MFIKVKGKTDSAAAVGNQVVKKIGSDIKNEIGWIRYSFAKVLIPSGRPLPPPDGTQLYTASIQPLTSLAAELIFTNLNNTL